MIEGPQAQNRHFMQAPSALELNPARPPAAASVRTLLSFDPDALQSSLQQGFLEHIQLGAGRLHGRLAHTASAGLRVDWGEYNLPVTVRGNLVQHMVSFGILISGASDWRAFGSHTGNEDLLILPEAGEL